MNAMNPYIVAILTIFVYMCVWFGIALAKKNNGLVDIAWGLGFVVATIVLLINFGGGLFREVLIASMIFIWGIRLATYLFVRNWYKAEDWRYANWRKDWKARGIFLPRSFFQIFMLQGTIMFALLLPIISVIAFENEYSNRLLVSDYLGIAFFTIGFLFEAIGDQQLYRFKSDPSNKGKILKSGLWKYTRHPNYFGEMMLWWGIFIISIPSGNIGFSILSPLLISFLLLKVSGVVLLEKKLNQRPEFVEYARKTSAFVPWFPK